MSNPSIAALREKIVETAKGCLVEPPSMKDSFEFCDLLTPENILALEEAWKEEVGQLNDRIDKLKAQLKQARAEADEERKSSVAEAHWAERQGEDYGTY